MKPIIKLLTIILSATSLLLTAATIRLPLKVNDVEEGPDTLKIHAYSSNTNVIPNELISIITTNMTGGSNRVINVITVGYGKTDVNIIVQDTGFITNGITDGAKSTNRMFTVTQAHSSILKMIRPELGLISFDVVTNMSYSIYESTNLTNWTVVKANITSLSNGVFNQSIGLSPNRFYKIGTSLNNLPTNGFDGLKVNFTVTNGPSSAGFLRDVGEVYGVKTNGYTYGWNIINTNGFMFGNPLTNDPIRDTGRFLIRTNTFTNYWELQLPNGWYDVKTSFGTPDINVGGFHADIEGIYAICWSAWLNQTAYGSGYAIVNVQDGRLTIKPSDHRYIVPMTIPLVSLEVAPHRAGLLNGLIMTNTINTNKFLLPR